MKCLNKSNTREILRDVSEVFDWSALEMPLAPLYVIWVSVVCERCLNKNNTLEISRDVSEVFDWSALEMPLAPVYVIWVAVVCEKCE